MKVGAVRTAPGVGVGVGVDDGDPLPAAPRRCRPRLGRSAFIRIPAPHPDDLSSHVREAQNRFPPLRDML